MIERCSLELNGDNNTFVLMVSYWFYFAKLNDFVKIMDKGVTVKCTQHSFPQKGILCTELSCNYPLLWNTSLLYLTAKICIVELDYILVYKMHLLLFLICWCKKIGNAIKTDVILTLRHLIGYEILVIEVIHWTIVALRTGAAFKPFLLLDVN